MGHLLMQLLSSTQKARPPHIDESHNVRGTALLSVTGTDSAAVFIGSFLKQKDEKILKLSKCGTTEDC